MSIQKDGYYIAVVQCDTGGETATHVRVLNGVPQTSRGDALIQSACSQFMEVSASEFCRVWSKDAAMELERLRKAGQDAIDYIDGKHRDAGRVLDGWRKANQ